MLNFYSFFVEFLEKRNEHFQKLTEKCTSLHLQNWSLNIYQKGLYQNNLIIVFIKCFITVFEKSVILFSSIIESGIFSKIIEWLVKMSSFMVIYNIWRHEVGNLILKRFPKWHFFKKVNLLDFVIHSAPFFICSKSKRCYPEWMLQKPTNGIIIWTVYTCMCRAFGWTFPL